MPATRTYIETTEFLDLALDGEVLVDIGQVGPATREALKRAVRAGKLVTWRGKWYPTAGAPWGIGPDKTCWSTPEVGALFADARAGLAKRAALSRAIPPTET